MPHETNAYPFEAKVDEWASAFSLRSTGKNRSFLVRFNQAREVESIVFESASQNLLEAVMQLRLEGGDHIFYDPVDDGMEFNWLSWQGVTCQVMERVIGQRFDPSDFVPSAYLPRSCWRLPEPAFPESWGVMF